MRMLWAKAPFVLRRHPAVLVAVVLLAALLAVATASPPLVRAGVASESLKSRLVEVSPLAAGFEVTVSAATPAGDKERRTAAEAFGRHVNYLGAPVLTSMFPVASSAGDELIAVTRTNVLAHTKLLTPIGRPGVWISHATAQSEGLHPGDRIRLIGFSATGLRSMSFPVGGIYEDLETQTGNPYWANWLQDIRPKKATLPPPPPFVFMSEPTFEHVEPLLTRIVENRFEYPVDPTSITLTGARTLLRGYNMLGERLFRTAAGHALGCGKFGCSTNSLLGSTIALTDEDVQGVAPTISLLSSVGIAIALALCVAAGMFLVRRRRDEVHVVYARGEAPATFAARTALETLLPVVVGAAAGLGLALAVLGTLAPGGTIASDTVTGAVVRTAIAAALAIAAVVAGAVGAFPRRERSHRRSRLARVPWEVAPIAAAGGLLAVVLAGGGLAHDSTGAAHPRLEVFVVPVLAVVGIAGLAVRVVRVWLATRAAPRRDVAFLAVRRLGAARGLLVAVVVATAATAGTFAYASALSSSLSQSTAEKAYVSNGSDVQGIVDPSFKVLTPFPFPVALVEIDQLDVTLPSGQPVDLIAGNPAALARTLSGWTKDPAPLLAKLHDTPAGELAAIATPGAPSITSISDQGAQIPVQVVGHTPLPGSTAGRAALLVSRAPFRRIARRAKILDPAPQEGGLVWAKGDPRVIEAKLLESSLGPSFLTTPAHIRNDPSVAVGERSYRYVRLIAIAAAVLSLLALLLYLQARQQSQLIASALVRRMGLARSADVLALALEAVAIVLFAGVIGFAVSIATAQPIAHHVDALAQYAPAPTYVVPWLRLAVALTAGVIVGAALGAFAALLAGRSDVGKALRVA